MSPSFLVRKSHDKIDLPLPQNHSLQDYRRGLNGLVVFSSRERPKTDSTAYSITPSDNTELPSTPSSSQEKTKPTIVFQNNSPDLFISPCSAPASHLAPISLLWKRKMKNRKRQRGPCISPQELRNSPSECSVRFSHEAVHDSPTHLHHIMFAKISTCVHWRVQNNRHTQGKPPQQIKKLLQDLP